MVLAFQNFKKYKAVNLGNIKKIINNEMIGNERTLNVCLLGAGRGPIMRKIVMAAKHENLKVNLYIEKPNCSK